MNDCFFFVSQLLSSELLEKHATTMRRGLGVSAVQRGRQTNQQFKKVGAELAEENMKKMRESLVVFQKSLEEFAEKHAKQIKKDPQFRQVCFQNTPTSSLWHRPFLTCDTL